MIEIYNCDMFDECGLPPLKQESIDAVITDFPYGTLNKRNEWDKIIDFNKFWEQFNYVKKENTPLVTTACMPFTAHLISTKHS